MSTMYDALKKAEAENKRTSATPGVEEVISDNTKTMVLLVAVIVVFAFAFYRFYVANQEANGHKKPMAHTAAIATGATPAVAAVQPPASALRAPGTYGLDGIIDSGANSMAIVNGKLLKIDDTIDTLTLKKISPKEVELLNSKDNSTVVLKIQ